jgi:hypothetical protein
MLAPPARLKVKALLGKPLMTLPALSATAMVTTSGTPEATLEVAKLTVVSAPLTGPAATVMVGVAASVTPLTFMVKVLAVPALAPVNAAV